MVKTSPSNGKDFAFHCRGCRFNPGLGSWDPISLSQDFKDGSHKKKFYRMAIKASSPLPDHLSSVLSSPTLARVMPARGTTCHLLLPHAPSSSLPTSNRNILWLCRHHDLCLQHSLLHVAPVWLTPTVQTWASTSPWQTLLGTPYTHPAWASLL